MSARLTVLAVLANCNEDYALAKEVLLSSARLDVRRLVKSPKHWPELLTASAAFTSRSPSVARRRWARGMVAHVLRTLDAPKVLSLQPLEVVHVALSGQWEWKTKNAVASVAAFALTNGKNFDEAIVNLESFGALWKTTQVATRARIESADTTKVLNVKDGRKGVSRRAKAHLVPSSFEFTPELLATVESIVDGAPDELGLWLLSASHPGWHHSDIRNGTLWLRVVKTAAGQLRPTKAVAELLMLGVAVLDTDTVAIERGAAAEVTRLANVAIRIASKNAKELIRRHGGFLPPGEQVQNWCRVWAARLPGLEPALRTQVEIQLFGNLKKSHAAVADQAMAFILNTSQEGS